MKLSRDLLYAACLSLAIPVFGAPAKQNEKRDVVVVHQVQTVDQYSTNTHIVAAPTSTTTNLNIDTITETTTRYTATVTYTVYGTPHTYTTIATTPISSATVPASLLPTESETETASPGQATTTAAATTTNTVSTTNAPTQTSETETEIITDSASPTVTSIPSSWIIENISTTTSDGSCIVNVDYYESTDSIETVTSTSTVYTTVTQS